MEADKYIALIHGPNLNLLGRREPEIYGTATLAQINARIAAMAARDGIEVRSMQSNHEGDIIDALHSHGYDAGCIGIVLNAGAYTHYSYAIADAIAAIPADVVEVHLSNTAAREEFRRKSVIAPVCAGTIAGFGADSYVFAAERLINKYKNSK